MFLTLVSIVFNKEELDFEYSSPYISVRLNFVQCFVYLQIMDGEVITAMRTAAVSAVATKVVSLELSKAQWNLFRF